jgi:hypothetical protein
MPASEGNRLSFNSLQIMVSSLLSIKRGKKGNRGSHQHSQTNQSRCPFPEKITTTTIGRRYAKADISSNGGNAATPACHVRTNDLRSTRCCTPKEARTGKQSPRLAEYTEEERTKPVVLHVAVKRYLEIVEALRHSDATRRLRSAHRATLDGSQIPRNYYALLGTCQGCP